MVYLDVQGSGTFLDKQQISMLPITKMGQRTTEHSTSDSLGNVSWIQKAALQLYRRNVPLLHTHPGTSLHVTELYQAFPPQVTNTEVRRPGYKARGR